MNPGTLSEVRDAINGTKDESRDAIRGKAYNMKGGSCPCVSDML